MSGYRVFISFFLIVVLNVAFYFNAFSQSPDMPHIIWYDEAAENWNNALPVGNGRMGAMVFGNPVRERLQLNEDSLWPGAADWGNSKGSPEDLAEIRELISNGQLKLADSLIVERFSYKWNTRSHQTMGDLFINYNSVNVTEYRRELNLDSALCTTSFLSNGHRITQSVFASAPDDVLVVYIRSEDPDGSNFSMNLSRPDDHGHQTAHTSVSGTNFRMRGTVTQYGAERMSEPIELDYGVNFETLLHPVIKSGEVVAVGDSLVFREVKELILLITCSTSFYHEDPEAQNQKVLSKLKATGYDQLLNNHLKAYQALYKRVQLDLGGRSLDHLTTAERLQAVKDGTIDLNMEEKLFHFGRYLLISSSLPGTNPANLQGLWNEHIEAPWNADYHLNINLQMNYWPAEVTNLSECHLPLFDLADRLIDRGKITAKEQYNMDGAVVHHTTDLWAPAWMRAARSQWGSWIHGGGWLVRHYWEHFEYTQDTTFLKNRAFPALMAFSKFYMDWLTDDTSSRKWLSYPETSPENSYISDNGHEVAIAAGAAMGYQVIQDVFGNTIEAAEILEIERPEISEIKAVKADLPTGLEIGPDGRLLEWSKPVEEREKGHRHISHLYALHPDDAITETNADLFKAALNTIQYRLDHGGAGPGWSRAWIINFYARLLMGNSSHEHIRIFLQNSIYPNLLDIHPPFQIDGNFGYTAGIAEMLMQSHEDRIRILPALPDVWKEGKVLGLKARGNITVDIQWSENKLTKLVFQSGDERTIQIVYGDLIRQYDLVPSEELVLDVNLRKARN